MSDRRSSASHHEQQAGSSLPHAVDSEAQLSRSGESASSALPHSQATRQSPKDAQDDLPTFPFVFSDEDLRAYWNLINVAVGLLLATTGSFLASIITSFEPELLQSRHYLGWSLVCFTTTLLINMGQQIGFATTSCGPSRTRERTALDVAVAECYLQDNLAPWYTCLFCRSIYSKQRKTRRQRLEVIREREEAKQQRLTARKQREAAEVQRYNLGVETKMLKDRSEEAKMQAEEAEAQLREAECQSQEAVLQSLKPVNSRRQELSRERERASRLREGASRQREEASRQREMVERCEDERNSSFSAQASRQEANWRRVDDARRREDDKRFLARPSARQKQAKDSPWSPTSSLTAQGYNNLLSSLFQFGDVEDKSVNYESSTWRIHRRAAFLAYQKFACAQTTAFLVLLLGLALLGVTHIKLGLVAEGAFIIAITCGSKIIGLGPSTFVHFIMVPPDYCD